MTKTKTKTKTRFYALLGLNISRMIFFKGWAFFRYTHSLNIWVLHNFLGLVYIGFQFVAHLVIAEALQIKLEPQQQTVSVTGIIRWNVGWFLGEARRLAQHCLRSCCWRTGRHCLEQAMKIFKYLGRKIKTVFRGTFVRLFHSVLFFWTKSIKAWT